MINIKEIKYTIDPIEYNFCKINYDWDSVKAKAWCGLRVLNSVASLFIDHEDHVVAILIQDLQTLLNLPAAQILDEQQTLITK